MKKPTDKQFKLLDKIKAQWGMISGIGDMGVLHATFSEEQDAEARAQLMNSSFPDSRIKYRHALIVWEEASPEIVAAEKALEAWSSSPSND